MYKFKEMSIREELRSISLNVGATSVTTTFAKRSMSSGASSMSSSSSMLASQHNNESNDELSQHEISTFASISLNDKSRENNNNSTIGKIADSFVSQARENLRQNIDMAARDLFIEDNQENIRPTASARSPFKSTKYFVKSDPALKQVLETLNQMNYQLSK